MYLSFTFFLLHPLQLCDAICIDNTFFCLLIIDGMFITDLTNAIFKYDIIIVMQKNTQIGRSVQNKCCDFFFYHINRTFLLLITVIKFK